MANEGNDVLKLDVDYEIDIEIEGADNRNTNVENGEGGE